MGDPLKTFVSLAFRRSGGGVAADGCHARNVALLAAPCGRGRDEEWHGDRPSRRFAPPLLGCNRTDAPGLLVSDILIMRMNGRRPCRMILIWFRRNPLPVD